MCVTVLPSIKKQPLLVYLHIFCYFDTSLSSLKFPDGIGEKGKVGGIKEIQEKREVQKKKKRGMKSIKDK